MQHTSSPRACALAHVSLLALLAAACSNTPTASTQLNGTAPNSGTAGLPAAIGGGAAAGTASSSPASTTIPTTAGASVSTPAAVSSGTAGIPGATASAGTSAAAGSSPNAAAGSSPNAAASAGASASAAGSGNAGSAAPSAGSAAVSGNSGPATFTRVWTEVLSPKGCAGAYCHGGGQGNLKFASKADAYKALVGVMASGMACGASGKLRVKAGDPAGSLMLEKMEQPKPSCGDAMPIGTKLEPNCVSMSQPVCNTQAELALVKQWITAGAKDD